MQKPLWYVLFLVMLACRANAQDDPAILDVEVEKYVAYTADVTDPTRIARSPAGSQPAPGANFFTNVILADVTQVNGSPMKGTMVLQSQTLLLNPRPSPGMSIADVTRMAAARLIFEFLDTDGNQVGSIFAFGLSGGVQPPGSPPNATSGNLAIAGGTGAYLGARGSVNSVEVTPRSTSQTEDPSLRRSNGGGRARFVLQVFAMSRPDIMAGARGPEVFHRDGVPVSRDNPARPGEILVLHARGLHAGADRMPPVEVLVNGTPAGLISGSLPAETPNRYRLEFRVPAEPLSDELNIQVRAAWIEGAAVRIPLR
jgi:hypothetical protein